MGGGEGREKDSKPRGSSLGREKNKGKGAGMGDRCVCKGLEGQQVGGVPLNTAEVGRDSHAPAQARSGVVS